MDIRPDDTFPHILLGLITGIGSFFWLSLLVFMAVDIF